MSHDFIIKIRIALATHNKTQKWLAEKLEISEAYMSDIMNGSRKPDAQVENINIILKELEKNKEM
ncbi:XRE family transcriptional regulator [Enterococcus sp. AZ103]|uniref:XRE family transcriptional regulator n=1 Tax=Enterococcus sp. AZ103 TaxID=2774628 RepID=UPI003F280B24